MKRGRRRRRRRVLPLAAALLLCCVFAASLLMTGISTTFGMSGSSTHSYSQGGWAGSNSVRRRRLIGPGSYPPRCTGKCGRCTPCRPVHVTVPPGAHTVAEYYPEAWRCKCGNRLYLPTTRD